LKPHDPPRVSKIKNGTAGRKMRLKLAHEKIIELSKRRFRDGDRLKTEEDEIEFNWLFPGGQDPRND